MQCVKRLKGCGDRPLSKIIGVDPPAPVCAVDQEHDGKNGAKIGWDARQKRFFNQYITSKREVKNRHGSPQYQHRVAEVSSGADAIVGGHKCFEI